MKNSSQLVGIGLMVLAMQLVPFNDAFGKILSQGLPVMMVAFLKKGTHSIILLSFSASIRRKLSLRELLAWPQAVRGFFWWLSSLMLFWAIKDNDIPTVLALFFAGPLFVSVVAPLLLKEQFSSRSAFAALVSFIGALIILQPGTDNFEPTMLFGLGGGICYALYLVSTRYAMRDHKLDALTASVAAALWAVLCSLPAAVLYWKLPDTATMFWLVVGMGFFSAVGHLVLAMASRHTEMSTLAPYTYARMFCAIAISWWLFDTLPESTTWVGIALIVAIGIWAARERREIIY